MVYLLINSYNLNSQNIYSVDKWMEYMEELASETEDEARIENLYTDLSYLVEHPFELNSVTENELKRLPFLSDQQITSLLTYRTKYGKLVTLEEGVLAGGVGSAVLELLNKAGLMQKVQVLNLGLPDEFVPHGDKKYLFRDLGLDTESIKEKITALVKGAGEAK